VTAPLRGVLEAMAGRRVVVLGEAILDSYLEGRAGALSREAPVPVVGVARRVDAAGGAANTAVNLQALGARVDLLSVVGDDDEGERLRAALTDAGVDGASVLVEAGRRTLAKQRVVAGNQILVRFDTGSTSGLPIQLEDDLIDRLLEIGDDADAIVVSDYAYGVVSERLVAALVEVRRRARKAGRDEPIVVVDARDPSRHARLQPTAAKPNYSEAVRLLGEHEVEDPEARARQIVAGRDRLLERTGARLVAVTLDQAGAVMLERDGQPYRTYARPSDDGRACGAGDTYAAALALALAAGGSIPVVAEIASAAASVVVGKNRTASCTLAELGEAVGQPAKRIDSEDRLREHVAFLRAQGQRIVFTNGCFDLLHRGHVTYLGRAKALGDTLIVGVNSDASVRDLKGPDRPINDIDDRLGVLEALSCVDHVAVFDAPTPMSLIEAVQPDIYVKGGDYRVEDLPEALVVTALGGTVRILPYVDDHSTTELIARLRRDPRAGETATGTTDPREAVRV
jgi:D-beta-D-heptose 7-phosphate kinase / D-beta-D-heptose 1-phosphate adenosyltransferase